MFVCYPALASLPTVGTGGGRWVGTDRQCVLLYPVHQYQIHVFVLSSCSYPFFRSFFFHQYQKTTVHIFSIFPLFLFLYFLGGEREEGAECGHVCMKTFFTAACAYCIYFFSITVQVYQYNFVTYLLFKCTLAS